MRLFHSLIMGAMAAAAAFIFVPAATVTAAYALGSSEAIDNAHLEAPDLVTQAIAGDMVKLAIGALVLLAIVVGAVRLLRNNRIADDEPDYSYDAYQPRRPPDPG